MKKKSLIPLVMVLCIAGLLLAGCTAPSAAVPASRPPASGASGSGAGVAAPSASQPAAPAVSSLPPQAPSAAASGEYIGEEAAKAAALAHAGLGEGDVTFVHVHLDRDDGRMEYEVEFYSGNVEYDYDIDALTGEIRSFDQDAEYIGGASAGPAASGSYIGEERAKQIALEAAGLTESEVSALRIEFDYDDGRAEYDVEWYVGRTEYSYEIDAANGSILSYEIDTDG